MFFLGWSFFLFVVAIGIVISVKVAKRRRKRRRISSSNSSYSNNSYENDRMKKRLALAANGATCYNCYDSSYCNYVGGGLVCSKYRGSVVID